MQAQLLKMYICLSLVAATLGLQAQTYYPVRRQTDTIAFSIRSNNGRLSLLLEAPLEQVNQTASNLPQPLRLYLDDANLALDYRFPKLERGVVYEWRLALQRDYGPPIVAEEWELLTSEVEGAERTRRLQWLDRTEKGLYYGESYALKVERLLLSTVDCEAERPAWGADEQWTYWLAGIAGSVLVGWGQDQRLKKEDDYGQYVELWEAGSPMEEAQPFFDRANNHQDWSRWLTGAGWGVLAIDAFLWLRRRGRVKTERRVFDTYCSPNEGLTIAPVWDVRQGEWVAGLRFHTSF